MIFIIHLSCLLLKLSLMSYDDKGYREVIEEEIDEDTIEYKQICPYSLK